MLQAQSNNPQSRFRKIIKFLPVFIGFFAVVLAIIATYYLLFQKDSNKFPNISTLFNSQPNVTGLKINSQQQGVENAGVYYTLFGQITQIQYRGGMYTIDLSSQAGEKILDDLKVYDGLVAYVNTQNSDKTSTSLQLSNLKEGDLVQIQINGDLRKDTYKVISITKIIE